MTAQDRAAMPRMVLDPGTGGVVDYLGLTFRLNALAGDQGFVLKKSPDLSPGSWLTVPPDVYDILGTDPGTGDDIIRVMIDVRGENMQFLQIQPVP